MKLTFVTVAIFLMSGFGFANNDADIGSTEQNHDLIQEYFDSTLENNEEASNNTDKDDNRFNRIAESTDGATATDASGEATSSTEVAPADDGSKPKKVSKKKKKKKPSEGEGSAGAGSGHGTQESGAPYSANVDLGLTYSSKSSTRKYSDTPLKDTSTKLELTLKYLFILAKMEIGPMIAYKSENSKIPNSSSSSTTETASTIGFGGAFYFNLGNIHQDKFIPYAGLKLLKLSTNSTSKTDSSTETKSSSTSLDAGVELGSKYFMGGHVALKPFLSFDMTLSGEDKDDSSGSELVASVSGSKLSLGLGLATYF
jgi:hypothetical protein